MRGDEALKERKVSELTRELEGIKDGLHELQRSSMETSKMSLYEVQQIKKAHKKLSAEYKRKLKSLESLQQEQLPF